MHFYERIKQKFVYIYLFVLARHFYRFLKNFPNVGYDILDRGYRHAIVRSFGPLCYDPITVLVNNRTERSIITSLNAVKIERGLEV